MYWADRSERVDAARERYLSYQRRYYQTHKKGKVSKKPKPFTPCGMAWLPKITEHYEHYDTIHEWRALSAGTHRRRTMITGEAVFNIPSSDDDFMVEYTFSEGVPGTQYNKHGDPGDAPEGDEVEIVTVKLMLPDGTLGPDISATMDKNDLASLEEQIADKEDCAEDEGSKEDLDWSDDDEAFYFNGSSSETDEEDDFLDDDIEEGDFGDDEIDRGIDDKEDD
jgi:hypothetical protein